MKKREGVLFFLDLYKTEKNFFKGTQKFQYNLVIILLNFNIIHKMCSFFTPISTKWRNPLSSITPFSILLTFFVEVNFSKPVKDIHFKIEILFHHKKRGIHFKTTSHPKIHFGIISYAPFLT